MSYALWDRQTTINGVEASHFLNSQPFKNYNGDIILIYAENGRVSNVECKTILANIYGLDETLGLDDFMSAYYEKLEELNAQQEEE